MILFEHLNVGIIWEAIFATGWEIGRLPPRSIQILFDLWRRHDGGRLSRVCDKSRCEDTLWLDKMRVVEIYVGGMQLEELSRLGQPRRTKSQPTSRL